MVTGSLIILSVFGLIGLMAQLAQNSAILKVQDTNKFLFDLINKKDLEYLGRFNVLSGTVNSVQEQSEQRIKDVLGITNNIGLELNNISSQVSSLNNEINGLASKEIEPDADNIDELDKLNELVQGLDGWSVHIDNTSCYLDVYGNLINLGVTAYDSKFKLQSILTGVALSQLNSQNKTNKEV